MGEMGVVFTYV